MVVMACFSAPSVIIMEVANRNKEHVYQHVHFEHWLKMKWLILQLQIFMLLMMHSDIKTVQQLETE